MQTTEGVSDSQVKCPSGSQGVVFPSLSLSLPVGDRRPPAATRSPFPSRYTRLLSVAIA